MNEAPCSAADQPLSPIHTFSGVVQHGEGNGHTVGMPTANIPYTGPVGQALFGVYASLVEIEDALYIGVTNVGLRPTLGDGQEPTVETYIPGFSRDIYGREITVTLYLFLRPTVQMASLAQVQAQVSRDVRTAQERLSGVLSSKKAAAASK